MDEKKEDGTGGRPLPNKGSINHHIKVYPKDLQEFYKRKTVKETIQLFSEYKGLFRALNYDFHGQYVKNTRGKKLIDPIEDYETIIPKVNRSLYITLNFFDEGFIRDYHDGDIDALEGTRAYTLALDIDLQGSIDDDIDRSLLLKAVRCIYNELEPLTGEHMIVFTSGNGAYIILHPDYAKIKSEDIDQIRVAYEDIFKAFNLFISDIQERLYQEHPEMRGKIKIDPINNRRRYIKAPLSLHKELPYIVYPMNPWDDEIPRKTINDIIDDEILETQREIYSFIKNEPSPQDRRRFIDTLKDYQEMIEENRSEYDGLNIEPPEKAISFDIIIQEPVTKAIFDKSLWRDGPGGRHKRIAYMTTILARAGWTKESIKSKIYEIVKDWGLKHYQIDHVIESWYEMNPPSIQTIYEDTEAYPKLGMKEFKDKLPEKPKYKNPMQEITRIAKRELEGIDQVHYGDDKVIGLYPHDKKITIKTKKRKEWKEEPFINAYPENIEVTNNPITGMRMFKIEFARKDNPGLKLEGKLPGILEGLREEGLLEGGGYRAGEFLNTLINELEARGEVKKKFDIGVPGFYHYNGKIRISRWELGEPTTDRIKEALNTLEKFIEDFRTSELDQRTKLLTVVKWGLTAPFNYVRKQLNLQEHNKTIIAYGSSGTGKTTMLMIIPHIWGIPIKDYERSGSNIQSPARFMRIVGETTFPILLDESLHIFKKKPIREMIKRNLEQEYPRDRLTRNHRLIREPGYASMTFASNQHPLKDDRGGVIDEGLYRRSYVLEYHENERKKPREQEEFNQKRKIRSEDSPLRKLKALGDYTAMMIMEDPPILDKDPVEAGEELLTMMYHEIGEEAPEWIKLRESKSIEDIEEETTITIISRIYEDAMGQYETIKWIDEMTGERHIETLHDHNIKKRINTIKDRIKTVVKEGKLPYIDYNERTEEYVINSTFTTRLKKADGIDISLKSMGHLMQDFGWRHTKRKKLGRQFKAVVFKADKMLDMIEYLKGITISDD